MNRTDKLKEFYGGRTVYITGITGFKGTWLAMMLKELGANVHGIGLLPDETSLANMINLDEIANVAYGDITAPATDSPYMLTLAASQPDVVFHLAAQPLVSEGYTEPFTTFNTNIMGTVITHEILRALDKKISLVNVTTDKVYAENEKPCKEQDVLHGFDPYSLSKSCSDMITSCYRNCFTDTVISSTMRAGNVIGGGDYSLNRIVPDIVKAAETAETLHLRNPNSVRPYQHVFDVLTAYLTIGMLQYEDPSYSGEYNVGPKSGQIAKTIDIVNEMSKVMKVEVSTDGASIGHENPCLQLDSSLIRNKTEWKPVFNSIETVVKETALWYNEIINGKDPLEMLNQQIIGGFKEYDRV